MAGMTVDKIRRRLIGHRGSVIDDEGYARAAVAVVLRDRHGGAEFLAIERSERPGDPWSGHMALPGGRQQPADGDLFATATRETEEEVGINLRADAELLGHLDDVQAYGRGRPLELLITPFVCALTAPVTLSLSAQEVQSALWVPVAALEHPDAQGRYTYRLGPVETHHEAFVYRGHIIWGLTYRILNLLLEALR
jgi:8-oxo-dGTP pyrophosphatase MutT (NUDIX family)